MKKFKFALETLLQVRERQEEQAHQALAAAHRKLQERISYVETLEAENRSVEETIRCKRGASLNAADMKEKLQYMELVRKRIAEGQDAVMLARNVAEEKRQVALGAMRDRKTIENLKEKQYVKWHKEVESSERTALDELATMRYVRGDKR